MDAQADDAIIRFRSAGSHGVDVDQSAFTGKVPVAITFALVPDEERSVLIQGLDAALHDFGERRVQLLVVVDGDPVAVAAGLDVKVTLMADDGLGGRLGATPDGQGRIATVVLDNRGAAVDTVWHLPVGDHALAVLNALQHLADEFPERFETLPDVSSAAAVPDTITGTGTGALPDSSDRLHG